MNEKRKFECEILESYGVCESELFQKMVKRGDITSKKIKDSVDEILEINGFAYCHIETDEKNFNIGYYSTNKGFYSTGSEVFKNSVKDYIKDINKFLIVKVVTKKGVTFKASPVLDFNVSDEGIIE